MQVLEQYDTHSPLVLPGAPGVVEIDERGARRDLRDQISRLESDLGACFVAAFPRTGLSWAVAGSDGPRLLGLGELERLRDELADRLSIVRTELSARAEVEQANRCLVEAMLADPARYKYVRVKHEDIGEPGCKSWHVRPRLGIIGMLMGWWHVKISSGCPLAQGSRQSATPPKTC